MTETVRSYRELQIWQKGISLVKMVYETTQSFPKTEIYGLASQMQRAALSIPSNIAEGQGRQHTAGFRQFLHIAIGSAAEHDKPRWLLLLILDIFRKIKLYRFLTSFWKFEGCPTA